MRVCEVLQLDSSGSVAGIVITTAEDLHPGAMAGKRFIYEGQADSFGRVTWKCMQHISKTLRIDADYVPDDCADLSTVSY